MPFPMMVIMSKLYNTKFLGFYDNHIPCGFIYMAVKEDIIFIMFIAVDKNLRSKGYGSEILNEVQSLYPDSKIIISIERCDIGTENIDDRIRRKQFYIKNGYTDTGYFIKLSNIEQEILIKNGIFDKNEFSIFLKKYSNGSMKPKIWKE